MAVLTSYSTLRGAFSRLASGLVRRRRLRVPVVIGAVVHGNACASESFAQLCALQQTCEPDPGSDEQTVVAQFGRTHGSKRATRCNAAHRCARCGWAGESSWSTTCCYALCAPAVPPRPSHISRSSAPGLALICAGGRDRDRRCASRELPTRFAVLQHGALCCNTACSWTCHVQRDG